jgi:DNA-binding GntR family transcriptional regulator
MIKRKLTIRNLREKVYGLVRSYVLSNEVFPETKINEEELARRLGVSKTPVRDALSKLAHDGIVRIVPNRGSFKVKLTKADIREILLIREALETLCLRLAIENFTNRSVRRLNALLGNFERKDFKDSKGRFLEYSDVHRRFYEIVHNMSKSPRLIQILKSLYDLTDMLRLQYFNKSEKVERSLKLHKDLVNAIEKKNVELASGIRRYALRSAYESLMDKQNSP